MWGTNLSPRDRFPAHTPSRIGTIITVIGCEFEPCDWDAPERP